MLNNRVFKNVRSRMKIANHQIDYVALKFILKQLTHQNKKDPILMQKRSIIANKILLKYPFINSKAASKNLCIVTGKARSVFRFCRLSRMELKRYSGLSLLNGLKPSS